MAEVPGIAGYAEEAPVLLERYETYDFEQIHAPVQHLLPTTPSRVLEIGAGTGRDAAAFVRMGHEVIAVEHYNRSPVLSRAWVHRPGSGFAMARRCGCVANE